MSVASAGSSVKLSSGAMDVATLHVCLAHSLKAIGRQAEAVVHYQAAAGLRPNFWDAYWSLANLKTYRFSPEEIERMRAAESAVPHVRPRRAIYLTRNTSCAARDRESGMRTGINSSTCC